MQLRIPAVYMRGGTSKAVFFHERDLPVDPATRDRVILDVYGSPDPYGGQLDGMGGARSITSKVAIISASENPDADVDYVFGQVSIDRPLVAYQGNCGNISAAVGPYAIREGLVDAEEPVTTVRIRQVNTGKLIVADIPVQDGEVQERGDYAICGVPGSGAKITLRFLDPGGSVTGRLLPTGHVQDELDVPGLGRIAVSIVDAGNPLVFAQARSLGMVGSEIDEIDTPEVRVLLRRVQEQGAARIGLASSTAEAGSSGRDLPKVALVARTQDYVSASGATIKSSEIDLLFRMMSMGSLHRACAVTGAICTAGAAQIEGTLVNQTLGPGSIPGQEITLGHPSGTLSVSAKVIGENGAYTYQEASLGRTARRLMDGFVYARI